MQYLKDFNTGDHVGIFVDDRNVMKIAEATMGANTIGCHIIAMRYDDVVVGWKLGEPQPLANHSVRISFAKDEGDCYPGFVAWAVLSRVRCTPGLFLMEGPCRQCSKKNSSLDKRCWWCQVTCPTDLKRTGP